MFLICALVVLSVLSQCDKTLNDPVTGINPDCNYAGVCITKTVFGFTADVCGCCAPSDLDPVGIGYHVCTSWICDPADPFPTCLAFYGDTCEITRINFVASFGFRALLTYDDLDADITCSTDPKERSENKVYGLPSLDFSDQVEYLFALGGYDGGIEPAPCDTCSPAYPCIVGTDSSKNVTEGMNFAFQADYNEHYDRSCATGSYLTNDAANRFDCEANYDFGQRARQAWSSVRGAAKDDEPQLLNDLNDLLWAATAPDIYEGLGLGFNNSRMLFMSSQEIASEPTLKITTESPTRVPTKSPTESPTEFPTRSPTEMPTTNPTFMPTATPTLMPTATPTSMPTTNPTEMPTTNPTEMPTQNPSSSCAPYTNKVDDLSFVGIGSNCRGGLNSSHPGGLTCESPYVICLPQENTPAAFVDQDYKSSTHRYSVDECLQECANDQRCSGIEFVPDNSTALGDCNLIDDIPVVITSMVNTPLEYDSSMTYTTLDDFTALGDALCFQKEGYCNPSFEAADLSEEMLNCYCPNNRKGFYTKKVKRTVENSRFCNDDAEVDIRIQKAQANRMFHLCENWCLFSTEDPEAESWYYNPWKACWRKQHAGSYCNRVIVNPDTIEMQFIRNRMNLTCNANY